MRVAACLTRFQESGSQHGSQQLSELSLVDGLLGTCQRVVLNTARQTSLAGPVLRQQDQRVRVARSYDREVTPVERGDADIVHPFSQCDDACVSRAQRKVGVLLHQVGHSSEVARPELLDPKAWMR